MCLTNRMHYNLIYLVISEIINNDLQILPIQLFFTSSGLTIDTTAANLVPSNQAASVRGRRSLGHHTRRPRQLWSGDFQNGGASHNESHNGRNEWLGKAIARARKSMTVLPTASNRHSRTRSERKVCKEFHYTFTS